jgi:hypothetical protein
MLEAHRDSWSVLTFLAILLILYTSRTQVLLGFWLPKKLTSRLCSCKFDLSHYLLVLHLLPSDLHLWLCYYVAFSDQQQLLHFALLLASGTSTVSACHAPSILDFVLINTLDVNDFVDKPLV